MSKPNKRRSREGAAVAYTVARVLDGIPAMGAIAIGDDDLWEDWENLVKQTRAFASKLTTAHTTYLERNPDEEVEE